MEAVNIDYDLLAQAIASQQNKMNPNALWSYRDIMSYLGVGKSEAYRQIQDPKFPQQVSTGGRNRRWIAGDVMKWKTGKRPR